MRVLVLNEECEASPLLRSLLSKGRTTFKEAANGWPEKEEACDAVLVLNDRRCQGAASLHSALELRNARPDLPIAVLTLVEAGQNPAEAMVEGLCVPDADGRRRINAEQLGTLMDVQRPTVNTTIGKDAITFEYQG